MRNGKGLQHNRFDKHPWLTGIAIALALVLVADTLVGTFWHRHLRALLRRGLANERSYRRRDSLYHHDLVPLMSVDSALWGSTFYRVRTNSLGFKDAEPRHVAAASDRRRILILGDSFAEGSGVEFDATVAGRLAALARPAGVEVLNAAVASYSPVIYFRKMRYLLDRQSLRVDEVIVLLDISDIQDETYYDLDANDRVQGQPPGGWEAAFLLAEGPTRRDPVIPRLKYLWGTHSFAVYRALSVIRSATHLRPSNRPSCAPPIAEGELQCRGGWTLSREIMDKYGSAGLSRARKHMSDLATLLKQRSIPMTVVVYPWNYQLEWNDRHSLQSTVWRDWAREEHVGFVDLFPAFFARVDSSSVDAVTSRFNLPGDVHWSADGHRFVEQRFLDSYCRAYVAPVTARPPLAAAICVGPHH